MAIQLVGMPLQGHLSHPDFYKVAISWAGNVDHPDKASWCERYMGSVVEEHANNNLAVL